jgi:hypothetical protein
MAADPPELPGGWLPPQAPDRASPPAQGYAPPVAPPQEGHPQARPRPVFTTERQPRNGPALIASFCAATSMGLLVFSLGLSFFFSLPLGIAGWVLAAKSDPELNPGQRKTGQMLSMIAVGLSIGAMIIWLLLIAAGISPEELQRNLEEELDRQRRSS